MKHVGSGSGVSGAAFVPALGLRAASRRRRASSSSAVLFTYNTALVFVNSNVASSCREDVQEHAKAPTRRTKKAVWFARGRVARSFRSPSAPTSDTNFVVWSAPCVA